MLGIPIQTCWSLKAVCSVIRTKEGRALRLECCLLKIRVAAPRRKGSYNMLDTTLSHTGWPFPNHLHIGFINQYLFVKFIKDFTDEESFQNLLKYIKKISAIPNFSTISKFSEILTIVNYEMTILSAVRSDPIFSATRTLPIIYLYSEYRIIKKKKKKKDGVDLQVFESLFAENFQHVRN